MRKKNVISFALSVPVEARLRAIAIVDGRSMSEIVESSLRGTLCLRN
jgi:hypothetical protein